MVSQYVVDGLLVGGLFIGVLGPPYFARGVYTITGKQLLRRTLVVAPTLVVVAVFLSALLGRQASILTLPFPLRMDTGSGIGLGTGFVLMAAFANERRLDTVLAPQGVKLLVFQCTFMSAYAVVLSLLDIVLSVESSPWEALYVAVAMLALFVLLASLQRSLSALPSRLLVVLGLILTLLGIAAQFVWPVLNLFGIKVV
jgi:hypothetical protein